MTFDVRTALGEGVDRFTTAAGGVLVVVAAAVGFVSTIAQQDLVRVALSDWLATVQETDPEMAAEFEPMLEELLDSLTLAVGLSFGTAATLWLVATILTVGIVVVAFSAFGEGHDRLDTAAFDGLVWRTANLLVGLIAFFVALLIGLTLLVLPGLLVLFLFCFFPAAICVDGENFVSAFGTSLDVVRSNLLGTLGLLVALFVAAFGISVITAVVAGAFPTVAAGIVAELGNTVALLFSVAVLARAYVAGPTHGDVDDAPAEEAAETSDDRFGHPDESVGRSVDPSPRSEATSTPTESEERTKSRREPPSGGIPLRDSDRTGDHDDPVDDDGTDHGLDVDHEDSDDANDRSEPSDDDRSDRPQK